MFRLPLSTNSLCSKFSRLHVAAGGEHQALAGERRHIAEIPISTPIASPDHRRISPNLGWKGVERAVCSTLRSQYG